MGRRILVEYEIISGRVVERKRTRLQFRAPDEPAARRGKRCTESSMKKIMANERQRVQQLARTLNCNFKKGDIWVTLKWSDVRLPESWTQAKAELDCFLRKARELCQKKLGRALRYVWAPGKINPRTGEKARMHVHIVMDRLGWETVCALWPSGEVDYRFLDGRGDYTGIARYMIANAGREEKGKRAYSASRGLKKPIYTQPVPVHDAQTIRAPKNTQIMERTVIQDTVSGEMSAYLRYVRPEKQAAPRRGRTDRRAAIGVSD